MIKTVCISSIDHISGIKEILSSFSELIYLPEYSKKDIKEAIDEDKNKKVLFVVPNNLKFLIDEEILDDSNIVAIGTVSTRTDHIDLNYCKIKNIKIISLQNDPIINDISSTAEHAFALMMSLIRNIPSAFDSVKGGEWDFKKYTGRELKNMTIGVVGFGRLGRMFCQYCSVFTKKVLVNDLVYKTTELEDLFKKCDIISLHVPLNEETRGMINKSILSNADGLYLINTSRGGIVNEEDIIWALENKKLLGYATDVIYNELIDIKKSLIWNNCDKYNIIITPHIGGVTEDAQKNTYNRIAELLKEYALKL